MTISDPLAALCEMRRVLKAGGALFEHGLSPEPTVERADVAEVVAVA
jgi:ubiquinone/menaquinone biosynthesis C-methylase UbiE